MIDELKHSSNMVLPTVYDDALSYAEALGKVVLYLNEVIDQINLQKDYLETGVDRIEKIEENGLQTINMKMLEINAALETINDKVSQAQLQTLSTQLADKALKTEVGLLSGLLTTAKTSIVNAINELFNAKANKSQEGWITPTLLNGWVNFSGAYSQCAYFKDQFGIVHLKGFIKSGTIGSDILILPPGYRPQLLTYFGTVSNNSIGVITISAAGNLKCILGNNAWVSLDGITFKEV